MEQQMEANVKQAGSRASASSAWRSSPRKAPALDLGKLNARTVEFIAKAGLSSKLRDSIERAVWKFLDRQAGFAGAAVLTSHKEPRRILILTFWKSEEECSASEWEFAKEVQKEAGPLIDAFSRVQTYNVDFSQPLRPGRFGEPTQPF